MYDFDKTLCTKDMQEYSFIPNINMKAADFWAEVKKLVQREKMDQILAYMYTMLKKAKAVERPVSKKDFVALGKDLKFFPGVEDWFERINNLGDNFNIQIEHYIISSGLREIIEGSSIYKCFKAVFACDFLYDENGVACWPKNAVNYTTKTQFLFRINKGILDTANDEDLNKYTPEDERRVPFRNMIYIGDGLTDVPCMRLVKSHGGASIAVYQKGQKTKVADLLTHERVDFIASADYTYNRELYRIVSDIICKMALVDNLKRRKSKKQMRDLQ
jgi:phosphoserine phosphatase